MKSELLASFGIVLILALLLCGCNREKATAQNELPVLPPATVSVARVTKQVASNQIEVVGTIQAVERAEIAAKITGNIINLPVDLGSTVTKGDLLIEISAEEISAQVQQAKAQLEQARRNLAREENLLKKNAATPQTVKSMQDSNRIAEAAYREAVTMLDYTRINAPFSGIITRKLGNIGDLATPGKPLLYLEEEHNLQVLTDIPEAMILKVHKGDRLAVFIPSVNLELEGVVAEISPVADPSSRSAPVKLQIAADPKLRSGQFARVTLARDQAETLTVPPAAVQPFGQMQRVFVLQDGSAVLRLVRTGSRTADFTEILSGLSEGETVVTKGSQRLLDGQPVVIE